MMLQAGIQRLTPVFGRNAIGSLHFKYEANRRSSTTAQNMQEAPKILITGALSKCSTIRTLQYLHATRELLNYITWSMVMRVKCCLVYFFSTSLSFLSKVFMLAGSLGQLGTGLAEVFR